MSKAALPQGPELEVLLRASGMVDAAPSSTQQLNDYSAACNAAAAEWGKVTGYTPFLANTADVLRKFDPPGQAPQGARYGWRTRGGRRVLEFDNGLVSLTSLYTAVSTTNAGTLRVLNTDFWLRPSNAVADGVPYQSIEFVGPVWGGADSIQALGKWGYGATVPDDAWQAMLYMAAARLVPSLSAALHSGMSSIRLGSDSFSFPSKGPFADVTDAWQRFIDRTKNDYLRGVV